MERNPLEPSTDQSNVIEYQMEKQKSIESAVYVGDGISFGEKYYVEGGLRFSIFNVIGPATVNIYEPGVPKSTSSQIDIVKYGNGENMAMVKMCKRITVWNRGFHCDII